MPRVKTASTRWLTVLLAIGGGVCCPNAHSPAAEVAASAVTNQAPSKPQWKQVYRHESGISVRYPDGWKIREDVNLQVVFLLPDDAEAGGRETIIVSGADGQGVTSSSDPRVWQAIEALVLQGNPMMKAVDRPSQVKAGTRSGTEFTWETSDLAGNESRVHVLTTVLDKYVVSVTVFGPKERVKGRAAIQKQIFDTLEFGAGPATGGTGVKASADGSSAAAAASGLAGTWMKMDYKSVGGSSWTKNTYATLRADGSVLLSENSESAHNFQYQNQQGNEVGRAVGGSQGSNSGTVGRWKAARGTLTITYANGGSDDYKYQIQPNSSGWPILQLQPAGGGKLQEWSRVK
jgi:hypothetical protein